MAGRTADNQSGAVWIHHPDVPLALGVPIIMEPEVSLGMRSSAFADVIVRGLLFRLAPGRSDAAARNFAQRGRVVGGLDFTRKSE